MNPNPYLQHLISPTHFICLYLESEQETATLINLRLD